MSTCSAWPEGDAGPQRTLVPVSAIEHWSYCPRQCALIHVEQTFDENLYTIRGALLHERADAGGDDEDDGVTLLRSLPLWSERHGLIGRADVVELRPGGPYPVEYKSGPPRGRHADLQLCGQALCLEEMFGRSVERGAVYHHATRRRREVVFTAALRSSVLRIVDDIRRVLDEGSVPAAPADARCPKCSLVETCLPRIIAAAGRLRRLDDSLLRPQPYVGEA